MLLCQFLVLAGNRFCFLFWLEIVFGVMYVLRVQYSCAVVSVFLLWWESFITTGKKKFNSSVWRVVLLCQFLVLAGNRQFFCCGGKVLFRPEKKLVVVVCLAGCAVVSVFGSGGK